MIKRFSVKSCITRIARVTLPLLMGCALIPVCHADDPLPTELWGEVAKGLPYAAKQNLRLVAHRQHQGVSHVLTQEENQLWQEVQAAPQGSELFQAFQGLPGAWRTPRTLTRIADQADAICDVMCDIFKDRRIIDFLSAKGVSKAISFKIASLLGGEFGYAHDAAAAKVLIDRLAAQGDAVAINMKMEGLIQGNYGYLANREQARAFIDQQCDQGNIKAIKQKMRSIFNGELGYDQDPASSRAFIEERVSQGDEESINLKTSGLCFGRYGYEGDKDAARDFLEGLCAQGCVYAKLLKAESLYQGLFWGKIDRKAVREIINELCDQGVDRAIELKVKGLINGRFGFERNIGALKIFINELIDRDYLSGADTLIAVLDYKFENGEGGDSIALKRLIDKFSDQGNWRIMRLKIQALARGSYTYKPNSEAARGLIEGQVNQGNMDAIRMKLEGLVFGKYGYACDPEAARMFMEEMEVRVDRSNLYSEIKDLLLDRYSKSDHKLAFIEELSRHGHWLGQFLKMKGLCQRDMDFGYPQDVEAAKHLFFQHFQLPALN